MQKYNTGSLSKLPKHKRQDNVLNVFSRSKIQRVQNIEPTQSIKSLTPFLMGQYSKCGTSEEKPA